jgi:hypothetical protein
MQPDSIENQDQNKSDKGDSIQNIGEMHKIIDKICEKEEERISNLNIKTAPRPTQPNEKQLTYAEKKRLINKKAFTELVNKGNLVNTTRSDVADTVQAVIKNLESK